MGETYTGNVLFLIDTSKSMDARDYDGVSRIEIAKQSIENYVVKHPENKYALSVFAWETLSLVPMMQTSNIFLNNLKSVSTNSIHIQGTDFENAFESALNRFLGEGGMIVFVSDFEPNISLWEKQKLLETLKTSFSHQLTQKHITLAMIGVWKQKGTPIILRYDFLWKPDYLMDTSGKTVYSVFDKPFFDDFAKAFWAQKILLEKPQDMLKLEVSWQRESSENPLWDLSILSVLFLLIWGVLFFLYLTFYSFIEKNETKF